MLDEVIRKLTPKNNNEQTSSENALAWAKRVQVQWAQVAILNNITESHKFDKIKMAQKPKSSWDRETTHQMSHRWPCRYHGGSHMPSAQHMGKCVPDVGRWATSEWCVGVR